MTGRILVAGVGNIFLSDDGFGVEVARRLAGTDMPAGVEVADYGIRGMHLAYDLAGGYDMTILIDATQRGDRPGTVTVLEIDHEHRGTDRATFGGGTQHMGYFDGHGMQPDVVLGMLGMLGGDPGRVIVVGCEPACTEPGIGLTEPVAAAVDAAARIVGDLIAARPDADTGAGDSRRDTS